jgi:hypothetical protein
MISAVSGLFAFLISWLPSGFTLAASGLLLVVGIGGLIYQRLPLVPYRTAAMIGAGLALYASAWSAGAGNFAALAERQALAAKVRGLEATVESERRKAEGLAVDAQAAAEQARAAEARARHAAEVAAALPDDPSISGATSDAIRDLWRR